MILEITSFICAQKLGAPALNSCRNPHSRSRCHPQLMASLNCSRSAPRRVQHSLQELLRLQVQGRALLHCEETLDLQGSARLLDGNDPWVGLALSAHLLAHDLASLVP